MPMLFQRTETENKEPASIRPPPEKHVSIPWQLYAFGSVFMFLLWIFIYFYTKHQCDTYYEMCIESIVVFWAFPIGIVLTGSVWNAVFLLRAYHVAQKERLVSAIDHHFDYRNVDRMLELRLLEIAHRLGESYGTAEVDTLSQTITNNTTSLTSPDTTPKQDVPDILPDAAETLSTLDGK
jgi:hypothetical protein